jgi:hypothetical protein
MLASAYRLLKLSEIGPAIPQDVAAPAAIVYLL